MGNCGIARNPLFRFWERGLRRIRSLEWTVADSIVSKLPPEQKARWAMKPNTMPFPLTWDMTAQDIMTTNPHSIRQSATIEEAISFLIDKGFRAAPVIDDSGRPVGVISQSDIVVHDRENVAKGGKSHDFFRSEDPLVGALDKPAKPGAVCVRDLMTPVIFQVPPDASYFRIVEEMVALNVHRLFVVSDDGVLVGVVTALDLLRHMYHEVRRDSADWLAAKS